MITGKVLSVETRNVAEPTVADAVVGATVIYVNDASSFDEFGGVLTIAGAQFNYLSTDVESDSLVLAEALTADLPEQSLVEYYPSLPVKTALVDLGEDGDPVIATVPHSLLDKFVDGTRDDATAESVTLERRGAFEFVIVDSVAEPLTQASLDAIPGEEGYILNSAAAQMQDLAVVGDLGASAGSFQSIQLAGEDLAGTLDSIPRAGRYALRGSPGLIRAGFISSTTELRLFSFTAGDVKAGHVYEVGIRGVGIGTVAGDTFWTYLRYTLDGSEPTVSSPRMPGGQMPTCGMPSNLRIPINTAAQLPVTSDGTLRVSISASRSAGTGTLAISTAEEQTAFQAWFSDKGTDADASDSLQQTLKVDGSGSDNPPVTQFVKTFEATWAQSYSPGGDPYTTLSNSDTLWIGYDSTWGAPVAGVDDPDLSLIGFNYTAIMAALSGASTMQKCEVLYRGRWRKVSTGLDMKFITHDYSSFPGVIDPYNITGSPNTHLTFLSTTGLGIANNVNYATDLGATVGNQFKAGTRRGVGIIGQDLGDDSRGYIFGVGATYKPKLRFTYLGTA